jgi:DNA-directed RNA polymerase specialized sigma24 family protein
MSLQTTSGNISDMPKARKDSAEAAYVKVIEKIIEKEEQANRKLLEMLALEDDINEVLSGINEPTHQRLLRYRYINLYSWAKIAQKMNFSEDHVKGYLHGQALLMVNVPEKYLIEVQS